MKTHPRLITFPVFTCYLALLWCPQTVQSAAFPPPLRLNDTIEVYLFHQLCSGETFNGSIWQHDTVATFFRPGINGPDTLQTIEIDVAPLPNFVLIGDSILCKGDSGSLLVAGFFNTYQWSNGATTHSIPIILPGIYGVTVTASNGCTGTNAATVLVSMPDFVVDSHSPGCAGGGDGLILIENFFGGQAPYQVALNGGGFQTDSVFKNLSAGDYLLALRDAVGCTDSLTLTLSEPPAFAVEVGPDLFLVPGDTTRLSGTATDSVKTWSWQPAEVLDCPNCAMPVIVHPVSTTISLTVTNAAGCTASDVLMLNYDGEIRLFVPNIFSPNEDGENDLLTVFPGKGNWEVAAFQLFDRWGSMLFESKAPFRYPQSLEWDGRSRGKRSLPGVYGWIARLRFPDGSEEERAGDITIVR